MFIPQGNKEGLKFFEAMFKYQLSDEATTNDIFLFQQQPFVDSNSFGQSLIEEWALFYKIWKEENPEAGDWDYCEYIETKNIRSFETDAYKAFYALELLYDILIKDIEKYVFVQLATIEIKDNKKLQLWMSEWCQLAIGKNNFKLIVTDHNLYHTVVDKDYSHRYDLLVDIPKLMESAASQGSRNKKNFQANEFTQCIVKSNIYFNEKEFTQAINSLKKALGISKKLKNPELELIALLNLAGIYTALKKKKLAINCYEEAQLLNLDSFKKCQLGLFYDAFLFSNSEKDKAQIIYEKVIDLAKENQLYAFLIEVYHQLAYLNKSFFSSKKYIEHLESAISFVDFIETTEIKSTSIPYVASLLIKEYGENSSKSIALDKKMKDLVSLNWLNEMALK